MNCEGDIEMNQNELNQRNVEEFSRVQRYMKLVAKDSEAYEAMKERYIELKVVLTLAGANLTGLDKINEK